MNDTVRCSACAGTGTVVVSPFPWEPTITNLNDLNKTCPDCHGVGVVPRLPAPDTEELGET